TVAFRLHYVFSIAILLVVLIFLIHRLVRVRPAMVKNRKRLALLFNRCSKVGELHLKKLNKETLDVVIGTLGNVPIEHLVVYVKECDKRLRSKILKMVQQHNIEKVTMCSKKFSDTKIRNFFLSATETAQQVDIYETTLSTEAIFGKPRATWEKNAADMGADGSISVQVMNGQPLSGQQTGADSQLLRFR
ncbi:hypothetical protein PMAYCL1PPCAC_15065, partial [Pristionchus mayeri]